MFDASPSSSRSYPLMQDHSFAAALRSCGQSPEILPSGLVLLRRRVAGIPLLMLPRAEPPADLTAQLAQAGLQRLPLILSPERPCETPRSLRLMAPRSLFNVDLRAPKSERRAQLHQNWRHQLKQAENGPLRLLHRPLEPLHPLLTLAATHARRHRYATWPTALTAAFTRAAPEKTHLFTALLRGHPVAYMLFLTHGDRATYHVGYNTDAGRGQRAHNLLMWEAMNVLAGRGITRLDLGPKTTPEIDRFKRRTGAVAQPTGGTWLRWAPLAGSRS